MDFYIQVSQDFIDSMVGKQSIINPNCFFGYSTTIDSRLVTSINSANDFPDEFATIAPFTVISLTFDDFPQTPPIQ